MGVQVLERVTTVGRESSQFDPQPLASATLHRVRSEEERIARSLSASPHEAAKWVREAALPSFAELRSSHVLPLNISDFDGTLIKDASGEAVITLGVQKKFFKREIRNQLDQMLAAYGLGSRLEGAQESDAGVNEDIMRLKAAYQDYLKRKDVPPAERAERTSLFYQMCTWIFAGHTHAEVVEFTKLALHQTQLGQNYFYGAKELLSELAARGMETHVVSATFEPVVQATAERLGIPAGRVIGMRLEIDEQGRYTTQMKSPVTFREGKAAAARILMQRYQEAHPYWRTALPPRPLFAMGDSPSKTDEQLLRLACYPIVAEPQNAHDVAAAVAMSRAGAPVLIIDYERTLGGQAATRFDTSRAELSSSVVDYL
jgi:phosphoserine phosphatase